MRFSVLPKIIRRRRLAIISMLVLWALLVPMTLPGTSRPDAAAGSGAAEPPVARSATVCEPRLPLDIAWIETDNDPSLPGAALALVISARTDLPSVRLDLLLPDNASLLSGSPRFNGKLGRGEETRLMLRVASRGEARLQARLTAVTPGGLVFQRGASLDLGADGMPSLRPEPGRLLQAPDGERSLREFPAAAAPLPAAGNPGEAKP